MPVKYDRYDFEFDSEKFRELINGNRDLFHEMSELTGIPIGTLKAYGSPSSFANREFPYPSMTNFLRIINICDADPREFFLIEKQSSE